MAVILRYFTEFGNFGANHVKVVEVIPTVSVTKMQRRESSFEQCMIYGNVQRDYREQAR